ncbi:MAG: hypothetical protein AABX55_01040, partial [Nanoarchaeota archaeon]
EIITDWQLEHAREFYLREAFFKRLYTHQVISQSAEDYVRSLFCLGDNRINGYGIDAIDHSFSPPIHYEIKEAERNVLIPDTQLHYQSNLGRSYLIAVKRIDNIRLYKKVKKYGKNRKVLKNLGSPLELSLNFGDIFILPFEVVKEHYILQGTKRGVRENSDKVGKGKKYSSIHNLKTVMRRQVIKDLNYIIRMKEDNESISHDDRTVEILTFAQAAQIIIGYGDHRRSFSQSKTFRRDYDFVVEDGPILTTESKKRSKIFMMDEDRKVIDELVNRLTKTKVHMDEIKIERIQLYHEILEKEKGWEHVGEDIKKRLSALTKWRYHREDLFFNNKD